MFAGSRSWENSPMGARDRSANWWAGMRKTWGFTRFSETEEKCNVCGAVMTRQASLMKVHHEFHVSQKRHDRS